MMFILQFKASSAFRFILSCLDTLVWNAAHRATAAVVAGKFPFASTIETTSYQQSFHTTNVSRNLPEGGKQPPKPLRKLVACNYVNYYATWAAQWTENSFFRFAKHSTTYRVQHSLSVLSSLSRCRIFLINLQSSSSESNWFFLFVWFLFFSCAIL